MTTNSQILRICQSSVKQIEAASASRAIQHASGAGNIAAWCEEKVVLQGMGRLDACKEGNKARNFAKHLARRGFMLNVPISWLDSVS